MKGVNIVLAVVISLVGYAVTQNKEEVKHETSQVQFEDCGCKMGLECTCDPCLCENCPCEQPSVVEVEPQVIVEKFDSSGLESRLSVLEDDVSLLKQDVSVLKLGQEDLLNRLLSIPSPFTEEEIRKIVKDELKVELEFKTNDGVVKKEVPVKHTGTEIIVNPGEILMSIDGAPVNNSPYTTFSNGVRENLYQTDRYKMQGDTYRSNQPTKFRLFPRLGASVCGPNGCN